MELPHFYTFLMNFTCPYNQDPLHLYHSHIGKLYFPFHYIFRTLASQNYCLEQTLILEAYLNGDINFPTSYINRCYMSPARFIFLPIDIYAPEIYETQSHSVFLMIDKEEKKIFYFDSSGKNAPWYSLIKNFLSTHSNKHFHHFTFFPLNDMCLRGWNRRGLCFAFTILLYWILLYSPGISIDYVICFLDHLEPSQLDELINHFICYINIVGEKLDAYELDDLYRENLHLLRKLGYDKRHNLYQINNKYYDLHNEKELKKLHEKLLRTHIILLSAGDTKG